jgi:uncharacterized repeat protein (TIGR01451 family)
MWADEGGQRSKTERCLQYSVVTSPTNHHPMKTPITLSLVIIAIVFSRVGHAQVYIPDQFERDWLNSQIPGIVNGNGIMDTLHPGIASMNTGYMDISQPIITSLDLHGLAYLDSMVSWSFQTSGVHLTPGSAFPFTIHGVPEGLRTLRIRTTPSTLNLLLPELPTEMDLLEILVSAYDADPNAVIRSTVHIEQMPNELTHLTLGPDFIISWEGPTFVSILELTDDNYGILHSISMIIPPLTANNVHLQGTFIDSLDLSETSIREMHVYLAMVNHIDWPQDLELLNNSFATWNGPIQPFPETLQYIYMSNINTCLPYLPNSLLGLTINFIDNICIPNWPPLLDNIYTDTGQFSAETAPYCSVLNSSCPGSYPGIAGRVFIDSNANGNYDSGEPGLTQASVTLQPNSNVVGCLDDGTWEVGVAPGNYTITAGSNYPYILDITPAAHFADVPELGNADTGNDFAVTLMPDIQDLRVSLYADPARPGFDNRLYLRCENYGTTAVEATFTLAFDDDQTWLGSSIAPASLGANVATWNIPAMSISEVQNIVVDLNTAAIVPLGTPITHTITANPIISDETPGDNLYTFTDSVVGSFDPNDKLLDPGVLTPDEVALGEVPIKYTIRFQNTGTYLAERVVILDTLSEDLQWESMRFIASSHNHQWYMTEGVLHVIYNNIMLPDSTADEANSHGFFQFSMLPITDLTQGAVIENIAHIIFDFNEPIITPPAVFIVDVLAGVQLPAGENEWVVLPNPANDHIQLRTEANTPLPYRIMDMLGHTVRSGITLPNTWLDVQGITAGPYILQISEAGGYTSLRFMKL